MPIISETVAISFILGLSAFAMSFLGFGFALIAVPLLAFFMPVRDAVALQFPYCFALCVYQAWHYRRYFQVSDLKPLTAGVIAGLLIGVMLLKSSPEELLKKALAIFIVLAVLVQFSESAIRRLAKCVASHWWGHFFGILTGFFFSTYNIGAPAILYTIFVHDDPLRVKSFTGTFFSLQFGLLAISYAFTGILTLEGLHRSIIFAPFVILGSAAGFYAFRRTSPAVFKHAIQLILLGSSALLWWNS